MTTGDASRTPESEFVQVAAIVGRVVIVALLSMLAGCGLSHYWTYRMCSEFPERYTPSGTPMPTYYEKPVTK